MGTFEEKYFETESNRDLLEMFENLRKSKYAGGHLFINFGDTRKGILRNLSFEIMGKKPKNKMGEVREIPRIMSWELHELQTGATSIYITVHNAEGYNLLARFAAEGLIKLKDKKNQPIETTRKSHARFTEQTMKIIGEAHAKSGEPAPGFMKHPIWHIVQTYCREKEAEDICEILAKDLGMDEWQDVADHSHVYDFCPTSATMNNWSKPYRGKRKK